MRKEEASSDYRLLKHCQPSQPGSRERRLNWRTRDIKVTRSDILHMSLAGFTRISLGAGIDTLIVRSFSSSSQKC